MTCKCDDEDSAIEVIHDCEVTNISLLEKDKRLDVTQIPCTAFSKVAFEEDRKEDVNGLPGTNMSCSIVSEEVFTITYGSSGRNTITCSALSEGTFEDIIYNSNYEDNATGSPTRNTISCSVFAKGTFEDNSDEEEMCATGLLASGTKCLDESQLGGNGEEYIVLDGYESDVESDISAYEELQVS